MTLLNNATFYPTPKPLIDKMVAKIKGCDHLKILEPSAGKGDIINALEKKAEYDCLRWDISAIEIDTDLQAILRDKKIKIIDSDFLTYSGIDKFDIIIANPPFDEGDKHLLKAIDILYRGEIIFLLNAETIKNPYTNTRKELIKRITELNAEIEYIPNAFLNAERPTEVEIALIYIHIKRNIEDDIFKNCGDKIKEVNLDFSVNHEVTTGKTIQEIVAEYNQIINIGIKTILNYYENYSKIGMYIGLNKEAESEYAFCHSDTDLTSMAQKNINELIGKVRTYYWHKTLELPEIEQRLTTDKRNEFIHKLNEYSNMDLTENNIRQFVLNILGTFEKDIMDAILKIFDTFTKKHCYSDGLYEDNIHYFNGWKTNKAFKVNKKVIIPIYLWNDIWHKFQVDYNSRQRELNDIDIVMNYFDGMQKGYLSIIDALTSAFKQGQTSGIHSKYFTITCYKKGTIHLTFNDANILRRFNLAACLGKNWLPHDYGKKTYQNMDVEEKSVVESFEGIESYMANLNKPLFNIPLNSILQIENAGQELK